jgi:hypothetical protein
MAVRFHYITEEATTAIGSRLSFDQTVGTLAVSKSSCLAAGGALHWRTVLTTKDKTEADAMEQAMAQDGVKARVEEITPKKR